MVISRAKQVDNLQANNRLKVFVQKIADFYGKIDLL